MMLLKGTRSIYMFRFILIFWVTYCSSWKTTTGPSESWMGPSGWPAGCMAPPPCGQISVLHEAEQVKGSAILIHEDFTTNPSAREQKNYSNERERETERERERGDIAYLRYDTLFVHKLIVHKVILHPPPKTNINKELSPTKECIKYFVLVCCLSIYPSIHPSIYLSIYIYLSSHLSIQFNSVQFICIAQFHKLQICLGVLYNLYT